MGNLVIPGYLLEQAKISPSELRLEIAAYLFAKGELDISEACRWADVEMTSFRDVLKKKGFTLEPDALAVKSDKNVTEVRHFMSDLAGSLAGADGDELAEILSREFQEIEGEW